MTYHASWRNTSGLGALCIVVSFLFLIAAGLMLAPQFVVLGMAPLAYLYAIGQRLSVYMDEETLSYQDWLRTY